MIPEPFVVESKVAETAQSCTLHVAPSGSESRCRFQPGQFSMLYAFGAGEVPISIAGGDADRSLMFTIAGVGAVTKLLCGLGNGEMLGVRGPFGTPWPMAELEGKNVLLIAGGLGIAPLRAVCEHVYLHPQLFRSVELCYGARSPADLLYPSELEKWSNVFPVRITVDQATPEWSGSVGVVSRLLADAEPGNSRVLLCGPEIMMNICARDLLARGFSEEQIFLSLERNMQCAVGHCGHCQLGPEFVCKDGPVFRYDRVRRLLMVREL